MNTQNPKKQLGYTLIELSIGLAITSMVLVGVVAGVQKMMEQVNVNQSVKQITSAVDKIRLIVQRDSDASFITTENMTKPAYNAFTGSNVVNPGTASVMLYNALGNRMFLHTTGTGWASSTRHFRIWLDQVTPSACRELAASLEGVSSMVLVLNSSWQVLKDEKTSTLFTAAEARRLCPTTGNTQMGFEFLM